MGTPAFAKRVYRLVRRGIATTCNPSQFPSLAHVRQHVRQVAACLPDNEHSRRHGPDAQLVRVSSPLGGLQVRERQAVRRQREPPGDGHPSRPQRRWPTRVSTLAGAADHSRSRPSAPSSRGVHQRRAARTRESRRGGRLGRRRVRAGPRRTATCGHFGSPISGRMGERRRRADSAVRASQTGRSRAPLLDSGRTRRRRHRVVSPQRESEKRHGRRAARRRPVGVGHASQSVNGRHPCLKARVDLRRRLSRTLRSARRAPLTLIRTSRILVPQKRRKPRGANAERLSRGAHPRIAGAVPSSGSS